MSADTFEPLPQKLTSDSLSLSIDEAHTGKQQEQLRLLGAIANQIRKSSQLEEILNTSLSVIRQVLNADRVLVYQLTSDTHGLVVAESVLPEWTPSWGLEIENEVGKVWAAPNIYAAGLNKSQLQLLEQLQVKAELVVPIVVERFEAEEVISAGAASTPDTWGFLIVHQCSAPRQWQQFEVDLLKQVTVQLEIAINKSKLYHKVQTLATELKTKINERTAAEREKSDRQQVELVLKEREAMLRRIGDNLPNGAIYQVTRELDGSDRFSYLSAGIERLMEVRAEDALQDSSLLYRQFIPEDSLRLQTAVEESIRNLSVFDIQLRIQTPSNQRKWFHFRSTPHQLPDGRVAWDGLVVDVTDLKLTEETLRKSEALLAESQRVARLGNWEFELASQKMIWSEELFFLFNRDPAAEEPDYDENLQLYHPEDREKLHQAFQQAISTGESFKQILRVLHPDGTNRYFEGIGYAQFNDDGQVIRLYGTVQDITERKQALIALRQSEERLQLAIEASGDGLWDWNIVTGELYYSPRYLEMLGYSFDEWPQNLSTWKQLVHPDDRPMVEQILADHLKDSSVVYKFDYRLRTKSGQWKWIADYGKVVKRDEQGNPLRMAGTHRDISHIYDELCLRQQVEAALARSEEQLRLTLEFAHIGSWNWNLQTNEVTWNDNHYRLLGLESNTSSPSYQLWHNSIHPEDVERVEQALLTALKQQKNYEAEYRVIYPDGSVHWLTAKGRGIYNQAGDPIRMLGVIIDVSDIYEELRLRKQVEEKLKQAELRYRTLIEQIPGVVYTSPVTSSLEGAYISPQIQQLLNISLSQWQAGIFNSWMDYMHTEDRPYVLQAIHKTINCGEPFNAEYRMITQDGRVIWVQDQGRLEMAPDGKTQVLQGVAFDISDRKRAEQALLEKENFLRTIYDGVAEPIFVIDVVDNDFRYVGLNPAHEQFTGINYSQLVSKTPEQILSPSDAAAVRQHYQDCIAAGETITYEECISFKGEKTCWLTNLTPLRDENSCIYRIVGTSTNITARKRAEQMSELQAVITRNMAEGICLVRATDGVIVYANPKFEQMFGYDADELIGQHISVVNYEDEHIRAKAVNEAITAEVIKHGEATYEVHNIRKDGTPFWCRATTSVFGHPEYGTVLVAVQQDITEHKLAEEKIKASLKEKEVLLKEIHHRVKNNLGIVSSLLQMQCRRTDDSQAVAILRDSQNRIASIALVHEKLYRSEDLADIDFSQYIPDLTTHLFDSYNVRSSQIQLNIQVDDANLDIETAIPCGLIINELVSNALKYAFPSNCQGEIQVKFYQESNCTLTLIVRDNGVGLPADFDSKKIKTLGMTLVQGLVKQLKGTLTIKNQEGCEFKINFKKFGH